MDPAGETRSGRQRHREHRARRRRALGFWLTAALVSGGLLLYLVIRPSASDGQGPGHPAVGRPLSQLALRSLDNPTGYLNGGDLQGRVTLLCFWGTWCPPCREEIPAIVDLGRHFRRWPEFQLLAVSCAAEGDESFDSLRNETLAFLQDQKLDLQAYGDVDRKTRQAAHELGAFQDTYPTAIVLDDRGIVRGVWTGYSPGVDRTMSDLVDRLLEPFTAGPNQSTAQIGSAAGTVGR